MKTNNQKLTRGLRNKNPFNIRRSDDNEWRGKIVQTDGSFFLDKDFEVFSSIGYGVRAGLYLLCRYIQDFNCETLEQLIHRFCPDGDGSNNEKFYCQFIRKRTNDSFNDLTNLSYPRFVKLANAITYYESRYVIPDNIFRIAYNSLPDRFKEWFECLV